MTAYKEPFVASLWKKGAPEPFAIEELVHATDWTDAEKLALEWAEANVSLGGIASPTLLYLKNGPAPRLIREWHGLPDRP